MAASCRTPPGPLRFEDTEVTLRTETVSTKLVGQSVEGRPIECMVYGEGTFTILLMASIHGDEEAGTPLLEELAARLEERPEWALDRRVIVIANSNPDGVVRGSRYNAHGVDLNRNFPSTNWRPSQRHGMRSLSEPETRAIQNVIEQYAPDRILTFHQHANVIDYDGPAAHLARALEASSPMDIRRLGSLPGSLGSYAGQNLDLPVITVELPGGVESMEASDIWEAYGAMLVAAIRYPDSRALPVARESGP